MRSILARGAAAALVVLVGVVGCGDQTSGSVSGTVKVDGTTGEEGSISFFPVDGKGTTEGGTIEKGRYSVAKVAVGQMKVKITAPKVVRMKKLYPDPKSPEAPEYAETLPKRYNEATELKLDIKPGANTKDWDLQSK